MLNLLQHYFILPHWCFHWFCTVSTCSCPKWCYAFSSCLPLVCCAHNLWGKQGRYQLTHPTHGKGHLFFLASPWFYLSHTIVYSPAGQQHPRFYLISWFDQSISVSFCWTLSWLKNQSTRHRGETFSLFLVFFPVCCLNSLRLANKTSFLFTLSFGVGAPLVEA